MASRPSGSAARSARPAGVPAEPLFEGIVGTSPRMRRIFKLVERVAPTDSTVLLLGESGTGKELVARSLHLQSRRAQGPFVAVNVAALPEALMESELFGHQKGAFTGAASDRRGLVEEADGGTLFLDEIGDMPQPTQVKLLRTLENSEVRRVGDNTARVVDVRVIAATHHDLLADVEAGRFRGDLYYRLNVVQIELPPLRERREDIGLLASYFLDRLARRWGRSGLHFTPESMAILERYDYPGNVRELENAIEHAAAIAEGDAIRPSELPLEMTTPRRLGSHALGVGAPPAQLAGRVADAPRRAGVDPSGVGAPAREPDADAAPDAPDPRADWSLADVEKEHIRRVLERHQGNATSAARQLGLSRTTLWRKLRAYGLKRQG